MRVKKLQSKKILLPKQARLQVSKLMREWNPGLKIIAWSKKGSDSTFPATRANLRPKNQISGRNLIVENKVTEGQGQQNPSFQCQQSQLQQIKPTMYNYFHQKFQHLKLMHQNKIMSE